MLEHVAPNQIRFVVPGMGTDPRGIALGRYAVVLLPSVDRVVALFRGLSERTSIDELLPSLRIAQVRTPLQSREFVVQLPSVSSYAVDGVHAVANLVGGLTFTGSAKHFVRYRDSRSPLGYDVDSLHSGAADFVLYAADFTQTYQVERELAFPQLLLNLSLQRQRGDRLAGGDRALLRVSRGLWRPVMSYLHRNHVQCGAAAVEQQGAPGQPLRRFYLLRCERLPERMIDLFRATPGIEVHRLVSPRVAVELGWSHPFELPSCSDVFAEDRFYLFSGARDTIDIVEQAPQFVAARNLVQLSTAAAPDTVSARPAAAAAVDVPLRLVPATGPRPRAVASRIAIAEAGRLKQLVYLLPPTVLASYGICVTERWIYVHCERGVDFLPLGEMYWAAAPGVLVPLGYQLLPRVHPQVLLEHLRATSDQLLLFGRQNEVVRFARADFAPLGRAALATQVVAEPAPAPAAEQLRRPRLELVNDVVGSFPLWGFTDEAE